MNGEQNIYAYALEAPRIPFLPNDLNTWFVQLESSMAMRGIANHLRRFHFCISHLPGHIIPEIRDMAEDPPTSNAYELLKEVIMARTAVSEQKKIQQLLNMETLGDRKPSQFLRHIRSLAGDTNDSIVRHIFLQRMPANIQPILATLDRDATLDKIAEVADQILEQTPAYNPTIASTTMQENAELKKMVTLLSQQMAEMNERLNNLSIRQPRASSSHRSRRRSRSNSPTRFCWYHHRYKNNARKCIKPCAFKSKDLN